MNFSLRALMVTAVMVSFSAPHHALAQSSSRVFDSEYGRLTVSIDKTQTDSSSRRFSKSAPEFRVHFEFRDQSGHSMEASAEFKDDFVVVEYVFPTGTLKVESPLLENFYRLRLDGFKLKRKYSWSHAGETDPGEDLLKNKLDQLFSARTQRVIANFRKAVEHDSRLTDPLFRDLSSIDQQRSLLGFACGALLAGFDLSGWATVGACAGCPVGQPLCGPCVAGILASLGFGAGAAQACHSWIGEQEGGSAPPECWQLDDGTILCVFPDGDKVEIQP